MKGFGDLMKQAQKVKAEVVRIPVAAAGARGVGRAGGGMVPVTVNGRGEVLEIRIDPEVVKEDLEMLQDLIVVAANEALRKSREFLTQEMGRLAGGLGIPGLL